MEPKDIQHQQEQFRKHYDALAKAILVRLLKHREACTAVIEPMGGLQTAKTAADYQHFAEALILSKLKEIEQELTCVRRNMDEVNDILGLDP